jgi:hypothetical protein
MVQPRRSRSSRTSDGSRGNWLGDRRRISRAAASQSARVCAPRPDVPMTDTRIAHIQRRMACMVRWCELPNGPRISCGASLNAHYQTFLRAEASASCMRLLGGARPETVRPRSHLRKAILREGCDKRGQRLSTDDLQAAHRWLMRVFPVVLDHHAKHPCTPVLW